jgi:hypothetical protein
MNEIKGSNYKEFINLYRSKIKPDDKIKISGNSGVFGEYSLSFSAKYLVEKEGLAKMLMGDWQVNNKN